MKWVFVVASLVLLAGCITTHDRLEVRPEAATDVPDHFLVGTIDGEATTEPEAGQGCRNPMVDPRDGTRLRLVRSGEAWGDYAVPAGRYGVGEGELLRLSCATGRVIGVVRR